MMLSHGLAAGRLKRTYATWNPADKAAGVTLSAGNLTATGPTNTCVRATIGPSAGKWYWEFKHSGAVDCGIGLATSSAPLTQYPSKTAQAVVYYGVGQIVSNDMLIASVAPYSTGDVIGFAFDVSAQSISTYKNNVLQYTGTVTGWANIYPFLGGFSDSWKGTANFGGAALMYSPPAGYNAGVYEI